MGWLLVFISPFVDSTFVTWVVALVTGILVVFKAVFVVTSFEELSVLAVVFRLFVVFPVVLISIVVTTAFLVGLFCVDKPKKIEKTIGQL